MNKKAAQSLQKIKKYAQHGRLGACYSIFAPAYYDPNKGTYCAIGCLVPEILHERIINEFELEDARTLWELFPELEKSTGIAAEEARLIQELNDKLWRGEFYPLTLKELPEILELIIQGGKISDFVIREALYRIAEKKKSKHSPPTGYTTANAYNPTR